MTPVDYLLVFFFFSLVGWSFLLSPYQLYFFFGLFFPLILDLIFFVFSVFFYDAERSWASE